VGRQRELPSDYCYRDVVAFLNDPVVVTAPGHPGYISNTVIERRILQENTLLKQKDSLRLVQRVFPSSRRLEWTLLQSIPSGCLRFCPPGSGGGCNSRTTSSAHLFPSPAVPARLNGSATVSFNTP
jgi:hypothetical protein